MVASARSQSALLGHTTGPTEADCFVWNGSGGIKNNCSAKRWWIMPLVYDDAGTSTFSVGVTATTSAGPVECAACSGDRFGSGVSCAPRGIRSGTGYAQSTKYKQGYGGAWMACLMPQGASISTLHY